MSFARPPRCTFARSIHLFRPMNGIRIGVMNFSFLLFSFGVFVFPGTALQATIPHRARNARVVRTHRKAVHRRLPSVAHTMVRTSRPTINPSIQAASSYRIDEIISGQSEAEKILFRSPPAANPFGFLILPDMKWDLTNVASLYLVALMLLPDIKSLRDLNRSHIPLLRSIRREAANAVESRWGLQATELRLFVHYQPSYCKLRPPSSLRLKRTPAVHRSLSRAHCECKSFGSEGNDCWSGSYARRYHIVGTRVLPGRLRLPFTSCLVDS